MSRFKIIYCEKCKKDMEMNESFYQFSLHANNNCILLINGLECYSCQYCWTQIITSEQVMRNEQRIKECCEDHRISR